MYVTPQQVRDIGTQLTVSALPDATLRDLIERASRIFDLTCGVEPEYFESALYPVWESLHVYAVGDIVTPTTPNSHKYIVTTAGTSGASQPTFPTSSAGTVTNGTVVFTENGADVVATNKTVFGDGTNYLRLPPYVPGTLNTSLMLPTGYTAPSFIERDGYLLIADTLGIAPVTPIWGAWWSGVPIVLSAKWGYDQTPADVQNAVIELVINLYRETDPANLKLVSIDNQPLREAIPPRVKESARRYRVKLGVAFA